MYRAVQGGVTSIEHGPYMSDRVLSLRKKKGAWCVPTTYAGPARGSGVAPRGGRAAVDE